MSSVFISSVIDGFEEYRKAAKSAVELLDFKPIMSENFGARSYSSENTCIHEVEQSDIYILVMGSNYGYETSENVSVTHAEFQTACAANRPILVFIQASGMEEKQQHFKKEVEDYQDGFFRASFESPAELKDEIIKALRQLETMSQAVPENVFNDRIEHILSEINDDQYTNDSEPSLVLAFFPQPERTVDIVGLEDKLDDIFHVMGSNNLIKIRDGYKPKLENHWTGIDAGFLRLGYFSDGFIVLKVNPTKINEDSFFSGHFAPPDELQRYSSGFKNLITEKSGYVYIALYNMHNTYVAPVPDGSSFSMKIFAEDEASFNRLFTPITNGGYIEWIDQCIKRFTRLFQYKGN